MAAWKYDVVIVGAGPAGITAAISLAKSGVPVLVVEAGVFPGAENWSGAVYFTENLAQPDVLGEEGVRQSAFERPVTKRGFCVYNGHTLVGLGYHNPSTFANCYTVLRPTYDHYIAELARSHGATILTETTVDGLVRDSENRIIGVHTNRGSIYADVVFLAEGDASHLVTKEGYERAKDPGAPHFLQGIKEVIELDPDRIESTFDLPRGEGAAMEILLRNGSIHNRPVQLNMGGFLYTNRASLSLGLVLPLDNLAREFGGDHNRLMEWYKSLPEVKRWTNGGRSIAYGAKIIRGGGFRELPQIVDNGLAIGGAATGIGIDFPYPNFTGPATAMGRIFASAVKEIRASDKNFSRARLEELYEKPVRQTHYFKNVEFLENWPRYVEHTRVFFGRFVDLKTGGAHIITDSSLRGPQKVWQLAKFVRETLPLKHWLDFYRDFRQQARALGLNRIKDVKVRQHSNAGQGTCTVEIYVDGQRQDQYLWPYPRLLKKLPRLLAAACDHVYRNDETPLPVKLKSAIASVRRGFSLLDYLLIGGFWLCILVLMPIQWICELIKLVITRPSPEKYLSSFFQKTRSLVRDRAKLDADAVRVEQTWEEKLALINYSSEDHSHIKVFRPEQFENRGKIAESALWHVCPAKVYECVTDDLGQSQLIVNFENCIKCETCWRSAPNDVDWTRQRNQRLTFQSYTESNRQLLDLLKSNGSSASLPQVVEVSGFNGDDKNADRLSAKLRDFCEAVYAEPRYVDAARTRWLHSLLEQAQTLAASSGNSNILKQLDRVIAHAKRRKFFWAEADARQLLEQLPPARHAPVETPQQARATMIARLDRLFTKQSIKDLEHNKPFTQEQKNFLRMLADAPSPPRAVILRELSRKDPSLAALVSGVYSAQVAARPELADQPWIGLTAARALWNDFRPEPPLTLPQAAADVCAIALGAGEMLLERSKAHAASRVQFPGLFKDEDGRDGIAKFGTVKQLLGEMEAQCYLLESLQEFAETEASLVKILAAEAFGPEPGSFGYNAGQVFGGTAYSEDDVLSKYYRDSAVFPRLLFDDTELKLKLGRQIIEGGCPDWEIPLACANVLTEAAKTFTSAKQKLAAYAAMQRSSDDVAALAVANAARDLFALRVVVERTHDRIEHAIPSEREVEIARVFARRLEAAISSLSDRKASQAAAAPSGSTDSLTALGALILEHGYFETALERPPAFTYREMLETDARYDYGDYLVGAFDANNWRYTPEMMFADAELRAYHEKLYAHFTGKYWNKRHDGIPYYRLVEKLHMVPLEDVRDMIAQGFMRMYIPSELGGEGLLKAHYYILCPLSMRYADPSYALTIMAHSSIGTTPVLLGLNQDIPRAKGDLQEFLANEKLVGKIRAEIERILRMLDSPEALKVKKVFTALGETVKNEIGKKPMLRAIASEFLARFMDAGRAGLRMDLVKFKDELKKSLGTLDALQPKAKEVIAELDRRAEAAKLFLRFVSAGQISAFALTEPSAGSDSGGIQTRAELKRVEVLTDADGVKYFMLGTERKNIIDAATVDPSKIDYSEYDYKTDDPAKFRYYQHDGKRIPIHDIGQIRREGDKEYYEYYELNGAKMWITNGHVAGVMCLYARTPEGPTGFMADRHAEGLIVGKDEEKMGQRGSPTNELGLTSVRVPRENIIGIEGRGQVNALESLNVGRTGLCISASAMTAKIIEQARAFARERGLENAAWVQRLIGEMTIEHYANESLAFELIGRADHHVTQSARTESAIGKYYASEVLHRAVRASECIHGIEGVTQLHELEKHRRDARVLNIYEGTNEVQRFLILRDLVDAILPKWKPSESAGEGDRATLAEAINLLMRATRRAVDTFGPQVWQNAGFQPTMFKLTDIAGYIKAMDSTLWRTEWLRRTVTDDAPEPDRLHRSLAEQACAGYLEHAWQQVQRLHGEFERDLSLLKQGLYPPEIRAAFLGLQAEEGRKEKAPRTVLKHRVTRPLHIVVAMNVVPVLSPRPRVVDGALLETHFEFDAPSRTALQRALEVVTARPDAVHVTVITAAPRYAAELLRKTLAQGAAAAVLLDTEELPDDVTRVARLLADQIALNQMPCDIVLCAEPVTAALVAGNLGFSHLSGVSEFVAKADSIDVTLQKPRVNIARAEPVVLDIVAAENPPEFSADDYFAALRKPLEIIEAREVEDGPRFESRFTIPEKPSAEKPLEASPESAADLLRKLAGVQADGGDASGKSYRGELKQAQKKEMPTGEAAVFVATPDSVDGAALALSFADAFKLPFSVVVFGNPDEETMRRIAGSVGEVTVYFVTNPNLETATPNGVLAAMQSIWKDTLPSIIASGAWGNDVLARFAKTFPRVQARYNVSEIARGNGSVELLSAVFGGRVQRESAVAQLTEHPLVLTLSGGAVFRDGPVSAAAAEEPKRRVFRVPLEFEYDRESDELGKILSAAVEDIGAKSIVDADFIIDVGYAIRNKENFDLIIVPLKKRLEEIGVKSVLLGGTRKVVEELKLLAPDQQIGQTGQSVNPKVMISIGVSGAPQHIDYIGERATIIAFNKDPDSPLMTLNQRRARPKVLPIVGDLYELVPKFTAALKP